MHDVPGITDTMRSLLRCLRSDNAVEFKAILSSTGTDVNERDVCTHPLLCRAVELKSMACTKVLLDLGADPNLANKTGLTPLCEAADNGRLDFTQLLVSRGADPHLVTTYARTPLIRAVGSRNGGLDVLRYLVELGVDLDHSAYNDGTALTASCRIGDMDKMLFLLEAGADVNKNDRLGFSPLEMAVLKLHTNMVEVLVQRGASPHRGLIYLSRYNPENVALVKYLIAVGADVNFRRDNGIGSGVNTPLSNAISNKHLDTAHILLHYGAEVGIALHTAVSEGVEEIFGDLISAEATPHLEKYSHIGFVLENPERLMSPFSLAMDKKDFHLARSFLSAWFLHSSDISHMIHGGELRDTLHADDLCDSTAWLRDIMTRPLSLACLSFVTVSMCVGFGRGRQERIGQLPIPAVMRNRLLFQGLAKDFGTHSEA